MANLVLTPKKNGEFDLQIRYHDSCGPTEYKRITTVSDETAHEIVRAGAAEFLPQLGLKKMSSADRETLYRKDANVSIEYNGKGRARAVSMIVGCVLDEWEIDDWGSGKSGVVKGGSF